MVLEESEDKQMKNETFEAAVRVLVRTIALALPLMLASAFYLGPVSAQPKQGSMEQLFGFWRITTNAHRAHTSLEETRVEATFGRFIEFAPDRIRVPFAGLRSRGNVAAMGFCRDVRYRSSEMSVQSFFRERLAEPESAGTTSDVTETVAISCTSQLGTNIESGIIWIDSETVIYYTEETFYWLKRH